MGQRAPAGAAVARPEADGRIIAARRDRLLAHVDAAHTCSMLHQRGDALARAQAPQLDRAVGGAAHDEVAAHRDAVDGRAVLQLAGGGTRVCVPQA